MEQDHLAKIFRILASIFLGASVFLFARFFAQGFRFQGFWGSWAQFAVFTSLNVLGVWGLAHQSGFSMRECYISRPGPGVMGVIVGLTVPAAFIFVMTRLPGPGVWSIKRLSAEYIVSSLVPAAVSTGFGSGINEEIVFRGYMLAVAEKNYGRKASVGITSVAFGLCHLLNGRLSPLVALSFVMYTGSMGVLMAVVTLKSGSIWNGVAVHWLANVSEVIVSLGRRSSLSSPISYTFSVNTAALLKEYPYIANFIYTAIVWAVIIVVCRPWKKEAFQTWMR